MTTTQISQLLSKQAGIEVLNELVKIDPFSLDIADRVDYLAALEKQSGWLQSLMQNAIVAVAGAEPTFDQGLYSNVDDPQREEIAATLKMAPVSAQSKIDVARLLTHHLPATCHALSTGEISGAQATVIAKESAALLRKGLDPFQLKYLEESAIAFSEFHTPAQVTNKVRSLIAKLDPQEFEEIVQQASEGRRVIFTPQPHGMAQILALLPAIEAQTVWLAIDKLARSNQQKYNLRKSTPPTSSSNSSSESAHKQTESFLTGSGVDSCDERTDYKGAVAGHEVHAGDEADDFLRHPESPEVTPHLKDEDLHGFNPEFPAKLNLDQLRADALADMASKYLMETQHENLAHGRPVTVNLTLDLPTFLGFQDNPGILSGYGEIPAKVARLLAVDGKWKRFITDPITGNLLDYGRTTYEPPQALVDFVMARDRRCRFPGCRQPGNISDIDHAEPWEEGGSTSLENLGLLCRRHHRMKTHGGWQMKSFSDGSCEWLSPAGKTYEVPARKMSQVV
jgi:hypothetical protein